VLLLLYVDKEAETYRNKVVWPSMHSWQAQNWDLNAGCTCSLRRFPFVHLIIIIGFLKLLPYFENNIKFSVVSAAIWQSFISYYTLGARELHNKNKFAYINRVSFICIFSCLLALYKIIKLAHSFVQNTQVTLKLCLLFTFMTLLWVLAFVLLFQLYVEDISKPL
jgi:CDP-diglyceride synthetase